jgi:Ankyrin repeats (many copies)
MAKVVPTRMHSVLPEANENLISFEKKRHDSLVRKLAGALVKVAQSVYDMFHLQRIADDASVTYHNSQDRCNLVELFHEVQLAAQHDKARLCTESAKRGYIHLLEFMHNRGFPWDEETCEKAAMYGHVHCLRYAHRHGCPWDANTCHNAAMYGQLDCLRYAHHNGCPWNAFTCAFAASFGNLECLQYAHEHGCIWNEYTCIEAVRAILHCPQMANPVACLRYAHKHGCPWSKQVCIEAVGVGNLACLKYLVEHGCPWDQELYRMARELDDDACANYLARFILESNSEEEKLNETDRDDMLY